MAKLLGHRQTKEAATDKLDLRPPRYISTLPNGGLGQEPGALPPSSAPFGLSLSKPWRSLHRPFDRPRANGGLEQEPGALPASSTPFGMSLSKPWRNLHRPFDRLRGAP